MQEPGRRGRVGDDAGAAPSSLTPILALGFGRKGKRPALWIELDRYDPYVANAIARRETPGGIKAIVRAAAAGHSRLGECRSDRGLGDR